MQLDLRKPGIQILLKKNVGRTAVAGSSPLSNRYAGANGVQDIAAFLGEHDSVRVKKSVRSFTGGFSIIFPDQVDRMILDSIYALIEPIDTIEVYMAGDANGQVRSEYVHGCCDSAGPIDVRGWDGWFGRRGQHCSNR
jgi:hypothetical protein